ncbi:hypothetical protein LguiA_013881 [Lonicera macranthoides]
MSISIKGNALLSRLKALLSLQRFNHNLDKVGHQVQFSSDISTNSVPEPGQIQFSKWRKVDSRTLGITRSMISEPSWIVLKILQSKGFEAYLVGGCVRDLLLNKIPKDFDVITTATLKKIRTLFHNSAIVGQRFPICMVRVKGSVIEVSSFETVAKHSQAKETFLLSQTPRHCNELDVLRWRNSMHRDFTINSLFFNPFANTIYDYANGMSDLRSLKLRTIMPAQLSLKEDCARILRGLRIAARLGLSFSKETETAIRKLSSSITSLSKFRIMMELNYMLSYGAAEPSLCLLRRFNLLDVLLPFHEAYLAQQARKCGQSSTMLMKLLFHLDQLIACDRPSNCILWVGLLAFHLALVNNPQHPLVVLAFASVLYHVRWNKALKFTREHAEAPLTFAPEILETRDFISDEELAEKVTQLALFVQESIDVFIERPGSPCSGLVFVSKKIKSDVSQVFELLADNVESHNKRWSSLKIDYKLLAKGNVHETRYVLGKIILETMGFGGAIQGDDTIEVKDHRHTLDREHTMTVLEENFRPPSHLVKHHDVGKGDKKRTISPSNMELTQEIIKKQKTVRKNINLLEREEAKNQKEIAEDQDLVERKEGEEVGVNHQKVKNNGNDCTSQNYSCKKVAGNLLEKENCELQQEEEFDSNPQQDVGESRKKHKLEKAKEKGFRRSLSSLFK